MKGRFILVLVSVVVLVGIVALILSIPKVSYLPDASEKTYFQHVFENTDFYFESNKTCTDSTYGLLKMYHSADKNPSFVNFIEYYESSDNNYVSSDELEKNLINSLCYFEDVCSQFSENKMNCLDNFDEGTMLTYNQKKNLVEEVIFDNDFLQERTPMQFLTEVSESPEETVKLLEELNLFILVTEDVALNLLDSLRNQNAKETIKSLFVNNSRFSYFNDEFTLEDFINFCDETGSCDCEYNNIDDFEFHQGDFSSNFECPIKNLDYDVVDFWVDWDKDSLNDAYNEFGVSDVESLREELNREIPVADDDVDSALPTTNFLYDFPDDSFVFFRKLGNMNAFFRSNDSFEYDVGSICVNIDSCQVLSGKDKQFCEMITGKNCNDIDYGRVDVFYGPGYCEVFKRYEPYRNLFVNTLCE